MADKEQESNKIRIRRPKKAYIVLALVFVVVILASAALHHFNEPSSAKIVQLKSTKTTAGTSVKIYSGKYIDFNYPSNFTVMAPNPLAGVTQESVVMADRSAIPPTNFVASVLGLPSGQLADDGGYHFRLMNPDKYLLSTWQINGQSIPVIADKNAGYSKVAFLVHGQMSAEIALNSASSGNSDSLDAQLKDFLTGFIWH